MATGTISVKVDAEEAERKLRELLDRIDREGLMEPKTKAGIKTTEFWLTLAAQVVGIALASGYVGDGTPVQAILGIGAMVLSGMGYTYSRGKVKAEDSRRAGRVSHAIGDN